MKPDLVQGELFEYRAWARREHGAHGAVMLPDVDVAGICATSGERVA